tara:strand:- start:495 stop:926 length:432 start_codon:yes stop_codon:yes gene_type:complete
MNKALRVLLIFLCFIAMAFVRFRESALFYDPLISFFHGDYQYDVLPDIEWTTYVLNIFFRYLLNMFLSLAILWLAFMDTSILKFSSIIFAIVFVLLLVLFIIFWSSNEQGEYNALFYVRRFLIQPLLIFILLPAFYYYRRVSS